MQAEIIVFSNTPQPAREEVSFNPFRFGLLKAVKENHLNAVCLIEEKWIDDIKKSNKEFESRGEKHAKKPLTYYFRRESSKIPFVLGNNYSDFSQLKRSINDFLSNASLFKYNSLYFIVVSKEFIDKAQEEVLKKFAPTQAKRRKYKNPMLNLISSVNTRIDLTKRYIGNSEPCMLVRQMIGIAAQNDFPVLILGETGTGKEVVARNIHECSNRNTYPFIAVNCGAIPSELFESELFGYKKGAFTGALRDKKGLWEFASGGTLFLDEIGDLALHDQVKILKALDSGVIMPVGGLKAVEVNTRIIAATNKNIEAITTGKKSEFRDDLFYRISTFIIRTPTLSSHTEDIPVLAEKIWGDLSGTKLSAGVLNQLCYINWPGNVRSLKHFLQRLNALFGQGIVTDEHIQVLQHQDMDNFLKPATDGRKPANDKEFEKTVMKMEFLLKASLYCEDEERRRELLEKVRESLGGIIE